MLGSRYIFLGLAASGLILSFVGCGDDTTTTDDADGAPVGQPPAPGPAKPADGGKVALGASKLYLGDTDRNGTPNVGSGWKSFGYNLDGIVTSSDFSNHCKPVGNVPPGNVFEDGNNGIDNAFGKTILPIILGFAADAGTQLNEGLATGAFTLIWEFDGLGGDAEYNPILTRLFGGVQGPESAKFDGTDTWLVAPELLNSPPDLDSAKIQFPDAYLIGNTWVSGEGGGEITLQLGLGGLSLNLPIKQAVITMDLNEAHTTASNGTIAGILPTDQLISELRKIAGTISKDLCTGTTFDSIANQLEQASDIMADGSQNSGSTCNGISIGLGFDATGVIIGEVAEPATGGNDPCAEGGSGGMGGAGGAGGGG